MHRLPSLWGCLTLQNLFLEGIGGHGHWHCHAAWTSPARCGGCKRCLRNFCRPHLAPLHVKKYAIHSCRSNFFEAGIIESLVLSVVICFGSFSTGCLCACLLQWSNVVVAVVVLRNGIGWWMAEIMGGGNDYRVISGLIFYALLHSSRTSEGHLFVVSLACAVKTKEKHVASQ